MSLWIVFTLLAASMQAVRTAGQKALSGELSAMTTTFVRYAYGLPFALIYLLCLLSWPPLSANSVRVLDGLTHPRFLVFASAASVAQILATFALVKVFTQRNFAVGTSFAKTEAIQVAVLGAVFFGASLSPTGWLAVLAGVAGMWVISGRKAFTGGGGSAGVYGLASGGLFAITSLFIREASLSLGLPVVLSAAITLVFMVCLQSLLCGLYILVREPSQWLALAKTQKTAWFVGATSALGSIGWFTAMSLQNPALVKTLGQVEFFITLAITHFYFRERIARFEGLGMGLILASVVLVLWPT